MFEILFSIVIPGNIPNQGVDTERNPSIKHNLYVEILRQKIRMLALWYRNVINELKMLNLLSKDNPPCYPF